MGPIGHHNNRTGSRTNAAAGAAFAVTWVFNITQGDA